MWGWGPHRDAFEAIDPKIRAPEDWRLLVMRNAAIMMCTLTAMTMLVGCATSSVPPVLIGDTPSNRIYWDNYAGEGFRIKITRDTGTMGSLCMTQIFIDGQLAAEIGQGEAVVFRVQTGSREIKVAPAVKNETCATFYSTPEFRITRTIIGSPGDLKDLRYGFASSGVPFLTVAEM
jgi:hypothetical protein